MQGYVSAANKAAPHERTRRGFVKVRVKDHYYRVAPAAGVNASITDLGQWMLAQLGHRNDVISPEARTLIQTPGVRTKKELYKRLWRPYLNDAHYGLGWRLYDFDGHRLVAHGGAVSGFRSMVSFSPETKSGIAILMNANSRVIDELVIKYWQAEFNALDKRLANASGRKTGR